MSSGSGSSDNGDNNDKCESPTPSGTPSQGSSNKVKRRPDNRSTTRPRHLKAKKDIYKNNTNGIDINPMLTIIYMTIVPGILKTPQQTICNKCEDDDDSEPVYQGCAKSMQKLAKIN